MIKNIFKLNMFFFMALFMLASCSNDGYLNTIPRFSELVKNSIPAGLVTSGKTSSSSLSAYRPLEANHNNDSEWEYIASLYMNNCDATTRTCQTPTPLGANASKCYSKVAGDYAMNGTSFVEYMCFYDSLMAFASDKVELCKNEPGEDIDVVRYFPMLKMWGHPEGTAKFQGSSSSGKAADSGEAYKFFKVKQTPEDPSQYIMAIESGKGGVFGYKNTEKNEFGFIWIIGKGASVGAQIKAFHGQITSTSDKARVFESIDVHENWTIRTRSNGSYLWYQKWTSAPSTANMNADPDGNNISPKDDPTLPKCFKINASISESEFVPFEECEASFGLNKENLNKDDLFTLKLSTFESIGSVSTVYSVVNNPPHAKLTGCYPKDPVTNEGKDDGKDDGKEEGKEEDKK